MTCPAPLHSAHLESIRGLSQAPGLPPGQEQPDALLWFFLSAPTNATPLRHFVACPSGCTSGHQHGCCTPADVPQPNTTQLDDIEKSFACICRFMRLSGPENTFRVTCATPPLVQDPYNTVVIPRRGLVNAMPRHEPMAILYPAGMSGSCSGLIASQAIRTILPAVKHHRGRSMPS